MNIGPVEETVNSSSTELVYFKAMTIDETGNMPIRYYDELTLVPNDNNVYGITYILISSFNYEHILKTEQCTSIKLCNNGEVAIADDDVIESLCGYMVSIDAATCNSVFTGSI